MARDGGDEAPRDGLKPNGLKIVTGGQTGVDRAALDAALDGGIPCGGWCPAGRLAEDGPIPARYPLAETPEADPAFRTRRNVADGDGTLIILHGAPDRGTRITQTAARELGRAHLTVDLSKTAQHAACARVAAWIAQENIRTLNIAGPRAFSDQIEPFDRDDFTPWLSAHRMAMPCIGKDVQRRLGVKAPGLRWGSSAPRVRCGRRAGARFA